MGELTPELTPTEDNPPLLVDLWFQLAHSSVTVLPRFSDARYPELKMQSRYRLVRRNHRFYSFDKASGCRSSLGTTNRSKAERLILAQNQAAEQPALNAEMAKVYAKGQDPKLVERTWQEVIDAYTERGRNASKERSRRATRSKPFEIIRRLKLVETTQTHFEAVLKLGAAATSNYLRRLHNYAMKHGWLLSPILPPAMWPISKPQPRRAITEEEHRTILEYENDPERRLYYAMLWETGGAQSDVAALSWDNVNREKMVLIYHRKKTGEKCQMSIGQSLAELLLKLPQSGYFFPRWRLVEPKHRSCEFKRRCRVARIEGVSLHCYRYAWAQRAFAAGYPERFAQAALGHKSKAIHRAYARNADVVCPALDEFEATRTALPAHDLRALKQ